MHDLLRILLDDLPDAPQAFAADRRERWLAAWAAAVRYIYVEAPPGAERAEATTAAEPEPEPAAAGSGAAPPEDAPTTEIARPAADQQPEPAPPAEPSLPARDPAATPLPTRGAPGYGASDPSTQPWYGFGANHVSERPLERAPERRQERAPDRAQRPPGPLPPPPAPRSRAWTVEDDARLVQRYRAGFTPEQLAELFGRSASAVRDRLMQLGVERR